MTDTFDQCDEYLSKESKNNENEMDHHTKIMNENIEIQIKNNIAQIEISDEKHLQGYNKGQHSWRLYYKNPK